MRQDKGQESEKPLGLVWISCPYEEELARSVEEALEAKARVHSGQEPPKGETPSAVLLCPNSEDVASKMKRIRALAPDAPVLVFCQGAEPRLAAKALRVGASGFVHAGMPPERIALALTLASEGEVLIPREFLGELLGQRLFLRRPRLLDP
jgi:DNA-binding NarL/FixJ family response regulator